VLPNRWELVMTGKNLGNEADHGSQPFPLILASEEDIRAAEEASNYRDFKGSMKDPHVI
jgi:hypothetical protein